MLTLTIFMGSEGKGPKPKVGLSVTRQGVLDRFWTWGGKVYYISQLTVLSPSREIRVGTQVGTWRQELQQKHGGALLTD